MSQIGMNLPGSQRKRVASMNIYTGLLFLAVVSLTGAVILVMRAGMELAPEKGLVGVFKVQDAKRIQLHD